MDWSKGGERWEITLLMVLLVVQLVLEGYGMVTNNGTAGFIGHLVFSTLWIVFGYATFRHYGTSPRSMLTVTLLIGGGLLNGYALLASNPMMGEGVAEILEGSGALLYASRLRETSSKPFQRT